MKMQKQNRAEEKKKEKKEKKIFAVLAGFLYAFCLTFGYQLEQNGNVAFRSVWTYVSILLLGSVFSVLLIIIFRRMKRRRKMQQTSADQAFCRKSYLITAAILFACYFIVFLGVYPGFFVYDANEELMEVVSRNFTTHHPLLHVLLLGGIIQLVHKLTASYNAGIACFILLQMTAMSFLLAYEIEKLRMEGMKKCWRIISTLYLALFPTIVMYVLCSTKDGLFAGMLTVFVLELRELLKQAKAQKRQHGTETERQTELLSQQNDVPLQQTGASAQRADTLLQSEIAGTDRPDHQNPERLSGCFFRLSASALLMCLFRHNGFYALLVFAILLFCLCKKLGLRRHVKKLAYLFAGVIVCYFLFSKGAAALLHAYDGENQELFTVPIQQIARVYRMEGDTLSEEQKETILAILPEDALSYYRPKLADPVKVHFNNEAFAADKGKYISLWFTLLREHPFTYLNAWMMTSYGFWYPGAVIDVYEGNTTYTFTYGESSYFGYETEEPGTRQSLIPAIDRFYRWLSLDATIQKLPVISLLFSPGMLFFVWVFVLAYLLYAGYWRRTFAYLPAVLVFLTVLLGPTYLVRYVIYLWMLLPVLLWEIFKTSRSRKPRRKKKVEKT